MLDSMRHWRPTQVQAMLLQLARRPEGVTTLQAGVAIHTRRKSLGTGHCGYGAKTGSRPRSKACCAYAASDGYASLKRLWDRGLVEQRAYRGPYFAVVNEITVFDLND